MARGILDQAGFNTTQIVASNDLDEHVIASLNEQGAMIDLWGVGTKLVTAFDQPALGGVYKLGAIRPGIGPWQKKVKLSEQAVKVSNPGSLQVRRFEDQKEYLADMIYDELDGVPTGTDHRRYRRCHDPSEDSRIGEIPRFAGADFSARKSCL